MPGMDAAAGMAMTFSASTRVTLFLDAWTTAAPAAYAATVLLLFALSVLHRFLGTLRAQLESAGRERRRRRRDEEEAAAAGEKSAGGGRRSSRRSIWSKRGRSVEDVGEDGAEETEPLSPKVPGGTTGGRAPRSGGDEGDDDGGRGGFWRQGAPWEWRRDGGRAVLEFARAALGYLLMLAVMTFNVGVFFAVLGGILVGELVFGRFAQGGSTRQEDGCHD
ncbi:hypothetical protein K505DRAFT_250907 [Neofusicoccum parvum]|nr:hypothetical protein K505DRAFT_250907 [Neofusicoccum parvum]